MRDRFFSRFLNGRDPIRALYVLPSGGFGGVERQLSFVLPQLPAWGVEVVPLVGPATTLVGWLEDEGVREVVHSQAFELPREPSSALGRLLSLGFAFRGARRVGEEVERLIHERIIDVVVAAGPVGWMGATEAARRLGVPLVWWAPDGPGPGEKTIGRALVALGRPDLLLCASEAVEAAWSTVIPAPSEVVTGAVDLNRFRRGNGAPRYHRPPGAREVVGFAGRLGADGDVLDFVTMAAELHAVQPDVHFLVAGDGPARIEAEELARDRGLVGVLDFLGYVHDIRSFYAACDVLVAARGRSRVAQSALEAMAMQVPTLEGACAAELTALLTQPARRLELAGRNHDRVRRDFDAQRAARRTARLLQTLVAWSGSGVAPALGTPARPRRRLELAT